MDWKILLFIVLFILVVDLIGTIHNFIMSRENRKLAKENRRRSLENKSKINVK